MHLCSCSRVVLLLCLVWPVYGSFKSIEANHRARIAGWLKFWVVLGAYLIMESVVELALGENCSPLIEGIKIAVLISLQVYAYNAPQLLYESLFRPHMIRWEKDIDEIIQRFLYAKF